MMIWLMRATHSPSILGALHAFQTTGSLISALLVLAAPTMARRQLSKGYDHA
ncbi:MAG: hypothetical protein KGJ57_18955 [Sphingomonadales bacterium]|nr:hypothetical protein [Sphingomonadales bacterium]MDE2171476.1 hypothetical protein [Sphingomonadales bacterium]